MNVTIYRLALARPGCWNVSVDLRTAQCWIGSSSHNAEGKVRSRSRGTRILRPQIYVQVAKRLSERPKLPIVNWLFGTQSVAAIFTYVLFWTNCKLEAWLTNFRNWGTTWRTVFCKVIISQMSLPPRLKLSFRRASFEGSTRFSICDANWCVFKCKMSSDAERLPNKRKKLIKDSSARL